MKLRTKLSASIISLAMAGGLISCQQKSTEEQFVEHLLSQMTLEEKLGQMTLYSSGEDPTVPVFNPNYIEEISTGRCGAIFASISKDSIEYLQSLALQSRLKIPMIFGYDVIHGFETVFPIPLAEAASWNMSLIEQAARISAIEGTQRGINWFFGPMIDVARDARWGRVSEGGGEDPYLVSSIAQAKVKGYQGDSLSDVQSVAACAKHFAAYGMPVAGKDYNTVIVSEQELQDVYLPPFQAAVDAGLATVMCAFNEINGTPCSANSYLLREVLQKQMGFEGYVVTDFATIRELMNHGVASTESECAELALNAGVHMDMESAIYNTQYVSKSQMQNIDNAVRRILTIKYRLGLFDDPYKYCHADSPVDYASHKQTAYELATQSIVLLENKDEALPLDKGIGKIAVIGPMGDSKSDMLGTWIAQGKKESVVSILEGIRKRFSHSTVQYAQGCEIDSNDKNGFAEAIRTAKESDVVIAALGECADMAGEAASKGNITLPGVQRELLKALHATGKKVILVITNGRPLILEEERQYCDALVEAWQLGTMAGDAIADVLAGVVNPSGKLPMTFPRHIAQVPIYYAHKNTGRPADKNVRFTSRYLDIPFEPLYPFGYGLSYTTFNYSNLELSSQEIGMNDTLTIHVTVCNEGKVDGYETVQLYIQDEVGCVTRPVRELKGFKKIYLPAGKSQTVAFEINSNNLLFTNASGKRICEKGRFNVYVGGHSNAQLSSSFILK